MRDKNIINVPVYRTNPIVIENNLFPPMKIDMITEVIKKFDDFNCSAKNNISVDSSGKNYKLEIIKATAQKVEYNNSNLVLVQMTVQKKNFGEEYVVTTPQKKVIPMSEYVKLGSKTYFFVLYPVIQRIKQDTEIKTFWNVFIYDDPNKDSEDFLKVVKAVLKEILGKPIRNIKYKEFLEEIKSCKVLDNISATLLTVEDVDSNYRIKYGKWIVDASLRKQRSISLRNLPSEQFQELFEGKDIDDVQITHKSFKINQGLKQYTLKRVFKQNAKTLQERFVNTVESCFNEYIDIGDCEEKNIYDIDYIIKNIGPIVHKYVS